MDKYRLVNLYASLFARGMKFKWEQRVYVDLYAGAGYARIRGTARTVMGSPLIALTVPDQFDSYVFCEFEPENMEALKRRVERLAPTAKVKYVSGDCNDKVDEIYSYIPASSADRRVLTLCFVDPFDIGIRFSTIKTLSSRFVDFLVLLAVFMDANRNYERYLKTDSDKVERFLGLANWRAKWEEMRQHGQTFPQFISSQYSQQMVSLGYLEQPAYKMKEVRSDEKNLPLYQLALYSRSQKAYDFWDEVLRYSTDQIGMF